MRIHIGSDHAGLELKAALVEYLQSKGHDVNDHGHMSMTQLMITQIFVSQQRLQLLQTQLL